MKITSLDIISLLLIFSPIVDNINGYFLLNETDTNISSVFKILILFVCLCSIMLKKVNASKLYQFVILLLLLGVQILIQFFVEESGFGSNLNQLIKMLMPFMVYIFFNIQEKESKNVYKYVERIVSFYSWFYPLSILIPKILNIGSSVYEVGFGSKGFYFAGNEVAVIMVIMGITVFQKFLTNKKMTYFICFLLNLSAGLMLGTKVVYLSVVIISVVYFFVDANLINKIKRFFIVFPIIIFVLLFFMYRTDFISQIIEFMSSRYKYIIKGKYENEAIAFLFSGRNVRVLEAYGHLFQQEGIIGICFGKGYNFWVETKELLTEMDFFDAILWYGLIITLYMVILVFLEIKKNWRYFNIYTKVMIYLVALSSILAGHVVFAPSVSNLLSIVLIYEVVLKKKEIENNLQMGANI